MNRIFAIVFSVLISAPAIADFDFKGIAIGKPSDRETVETKLGITCGKGSSPSAFCSGKSTIGGEPASTTVRIGSNGLVESIAVWFSASTFDLIEDDIIKKFGKPKTQITSVKTNAGAVLESVKHLWTTTENATVSVGKNISKAGDAQLLMNTEADKEMVRKRIEARKNDL